MARDPRWLRDLIADVPDFPEPGIVFRDITPLLADVDAFRFATDAIADHYAGEQVDAVVGIEARGFIWGAPVAYRFGAGFVPVRKGGKLPRVTAAEEYALEYGTATIEIHGERLAGRRVVLIDDVLATGGTAAAAIRLLERCGAEVVGTSFLLELAFLDGRAMLDGYETHSLLTYEA